MRTKTIRGRLIACLSCVVLLALGACSTGRRANPFDIEGQTVSSRDSVPDLFFKQLRGREFFVCCNLRFDHDGIANDANHAFPDFGGSMIRLGTRVRVVRVLAGRISGIIIQPEGKTRTFKLSFRYHGTRRVSRSEYFRNILVDADPRGPLAASSPEAKEAVAEGQLIVGLTKREAIMARGYPPFDRTVGVGANQWMYYHSPFLVDSVRFVDGRIKSIERGPPLLEEHEELFPGRPW